MISVKRAFWFLIGVAAATGCSLVDENTADCGVTVDINYRLRLVTDVPAQLHAELDKDTPAETISALQDYLAPVFSLVIQDADLAFFRESSLDHRAHKTIGETAFSYNYMFPEGDCLHTAVANTDGNGVSVFVTGSRPEEEAMTLPAADTVDTQKTGLFSARRTFEFPSMGKASYDVTLDMVNCAVVMVADTSASRISGLKAYAREFSDGFSVSDSTFRFASCPVVRAEKVPETPGRLCLAAVLFPTRDVTRADTGAALWEVDVYARCASGSVTKSTLGFKDPVQAGGLKIIKFKVNPDGSIIPSDSAVGVNVVLNWNEGYSGDVNL